MAGRRRIDRERKLIAVVEVISVSIAALIAAPNLAGGVIVTVAFLVAISRQAEWTRPRVTLSVLAEMPTLASRMTPALLVGAVIGCVHPDARWVVVAIAAMCVGVVAGRFVSYECLRRLRRRLEPRRCLIVGEGLIGQSIERALSSQPSFGMAPVLVPQIFCAGTEQVGDFARTIERYEASRVILAFGPGPDSHIIDELRRARPKGVEFFLVPRFFELGAAAGDPLVDDIWGVPLVWLRRSSTREAHLRAKRTFDVCVATALLVVLSPVMLLIAAAVRLSSRGPVLFRQMRIGKDDREFELLKFRSMRVNSDSDHTWSVDRDDRVTAVGRILRALSLDELPQLLNVVKGDMSLVGPRPERPHFVDEFQRGIPGYRHRHRIPVGLTGWAQIHGLRGDTSVTDRVRFDNMYIEHWSMWRDFSILLRTFGAVIRHASGHHAPVATGALVPTTLDLKGTSGDASASSLVSPGSATDTSEPLRTESRAIDVD